jgi:membrane-anchored protein YejM (alkaline phosphatase superfamily)
MKKLLYLIFVASFGLSCHTDKPSVNLKSKNVIIVVMDGPRWTETFGDSTMQYIPYMKALLPQGTWYTNFHTEQYTFTNAGHTAMTTGFYQNINNGGTELPDNPSFFQYWLAASKSSNQKAWVISTKDKLQILADCKDPDYRGKYMPATNCGNNGLGTGYRHDSTTYKKVMEVLALYQPNLMLVNFKEPDASGHANNWGNYINGIRNVDSYIGGIWAYIQSQPFYANKTTLIVTNDHGRHLNNVADGFISHGDNCDGCKHIMCLVLGPDIKKGVVLNNYRDLTDIASTTAHLMGVTMPLSNGDVMDELFNR